MIVNSLNLGRRLQVGNGGLHGHSAQAGKGLRGLDLADVGEQAGHHVVVGLVGPLEYDIGVLPINR